MSLEVLPTIRKNPRLEWRMASETARLAALVASRPRTSTPLPISVIQRTRAIGFPLVIDALNICSAKACILNRRLRRPRQVTAGMRMHLDAPANTFEAFGGVR